jgi:hypothetical protein
MRSMIDFLWSSTSLALKGALVQDLWGTVGRAAVAALVGAAIGLALVALAAPLWLATLVAGLVSGGITPYLLRNIKIA